jgi:GTP-binding protein Era
VETKQDLQTKSYPCRDVDLKVDSINRTGFVELLAAIAEYLPEGPYLYEEDMYTDQSMDLRVQEVIREQLFAELGEEIPYACYVEIGSLENGETMLSVQAYINTETDSQKTIVIGK